MGRRCQPRGNRKHGDPGGQQGYYNNRTLRDAARGRGRRAREELNRLRVRVLTLNGLHKVAYDLACDSRILADIDRPTSHLSIDEFCAYVDDLSERLFRLELQIAQDVDPDFYQFDHPLNDLSRALDLQDLAGYYNSSIRSDLTFDLESSGITVSIPGARVHFTLNSTGLQVCRHTMNTFSKILHSATLPLAAGY